MQCHWVDATQGIAVQREGFSQCDARRLWTQRWAAVRPLPLSDDDGRDSCHLGWREGGTVPPRLGVRTSCMQKNERRSSGDAAS